MKVGVHMLNLSPDQLFVPSKIEDSDCESVASARELAAVANESEFNKEVG